MMLNKAKKIIKQLVFFALILCNTYAVFAAGRKIDKIHFSKVPFKGDQSLQEIINSREGKLYEPRLVKLDRILLTNYFKNYGFLNVYVRDSVTLDPRKNKVTIYYLIDLGKRYFFGGVRFSGLHAITLNQLEPAFKNLRIGEPFLEAKVSEAIRRVEDIYYNSGKPYVEITPEYIYEQDSLIFLYLKIKENATVYIKDIQYEGMKLVQKFLIRRELEIKKGDRYNRRALNKSQQNLYATGLFRYVRFDLEPLAGDSTQAVLKILIQEKEARWIGFRLGVAHDQEIYYGNKLELTLQGGHRNLFGTGRSLNFYLTPSFYYDFGNNKIFNSDNKATLVYVEPWMFYTRTPGVLQVAFEQYRPLNSAHFNIYRSSFDVRKVFSPGVEMNGGFSARKVDLIKEGEIDTTLISLEQVRKSAVYSVSFYAKRDKRKNMFNPHDGSYTDASVSFSYSRGKNENDETEINRYITMTASWQRYQPFRPKILHFKRWNFTFATRLKIGAIFEPAGNKEIPIDDRFFAGGATTVRGYHEQLLGPAAAYDANGKIVRAAGGKALFLANAEVRMPLFWLLIMETFVDAGNVWAELKDVNPLTIKPTTGIGLAVLTPLGPVRIDFGYKLLPKKSDPSRYAIHAGLYFAF
ncbi:BamA/OMP85 family outer membrane protein [Calditrichota bacterium GD2]